MPPEFRTLPPMGPSWFRIVSPIPHTIRMVLDLPFDAPLINALASGGLHPGLEILRPDDVDEAIARGGFDILLTSRTDRIEACRTLAPKVTRVWMIPEPGMHGPAWRSAHRYLPYRATLSELAATIDSAMGGNGVVDIRLPKDPDGQLPQLPSVALELLSLLDDESQPNSKLKRCLQQDPLLVAKVLQMANSPYFGLTRRIGSLDHAIALLGRNNLRSAVLAGVCFDAVDGVAEHHIRAISERGLKTMRLVRLMAGAHAESAITAAVLVDIGMLLMMKTDPDYPSLVEKAQKQKLALHALEQQHYGYTHAQLGARLLHEWNLPASTVEAVAYSHTPYPRIRRNHSPRMMLYVASELIAHMETGRMLEMDPAWVAEKRIEHALTEWQEALADTEMLAIAG